MTSPRRQESRQCKLASNGFTTLRNMSPPRICSMVKSCATVGQVLGPGSFGGLRQGTNFGDFRVPR